jgi:phage tail protein X
MLFVGSVAAGKYRCVSSLGSPAIGCCRVSEGAIQPVASCRRVSARAPQITDAMEAKNAGCAVAELLRHGASQVPVRTDWDKRPAAGWLPAGGPHSRVRRGSNLNIIPTECGHGRAWSDLGSLLVVVRGPKVTQMDAHAGIGIEQTDASSVSRTADIRSLDRLAWFIYFLAFAVLPFAVVLFRTDMLAWHYYVAGAMFLVGALAICAINLQQ